MTDSVQGGKRTEGTDVVRTRPRGLLDVCLVAVLFYAVYDQTPVGALFDQSLRAVLGQRHRAAWLDALGGRDTHVEPSTLLADAAGRRSREKTVAAIEALALRQQVEPSWLVAAIETQGRCGAEGCTVHTPSALLAELNESKVGTGSEAKPPTTLAGPVVSIAMFAAGLRVARKNLALEKVVLDTTTARDALAVEALYLGSKVVRRAIIQASTEPPAPGGLWRAHTRFLPPHVRRGRLHDALAVFVEQRRATATWPLLRVRGGLSSTVLSAAATHRTPSSRGVELEAEGGASVMAVHDGFVRHQSTDSLLGTCVSIDHGGGLLSTYCRVTTLGVRPGQAVAQRDVVARVGASGRAGKLTLYYSLSLCGQDLETGHARGEP